MTLERQSRTARFLVILGLIAATVAVGLLLFRDRTPKLTLPALEQARALWRLNALLDYDITLLKEVDAQPVERLVTDVRCGKATRLTLNGNAGPARESYTVPGLFDTIDRELEMAGGKSRVPGQPENAVLRAAFHETLGAPLVVKRLAPNRQSYVLTVQRIEVPGSRIVWEAK